MASSYDRATSLAALRLAWEEISQDQDESKSVARFAETAEERLSTLADELQSGGFRPYSAQLVSFPKPDGGVRTLRIPTVRDRLVERAILAEITPRIDPVLGASSFAYRPGLGVSQAVRAVCELREEGLTHVVRADINDCFDNIPRNQAIRMLEALIDDPRLLDLIERCVSRTVFGEATPRPGLAQGSPLSPLLSNLFLTRFDEMITGEGFPLVRFADDLVIACDTRDDAWEAMRVASDAADALGLSLGDDKSGVMSFEDGFAFVGEDFGVRYPPLVSGNKPPEKRVVYVAKQGAGLSVRDGKLRVRTKNSEEVLSIPTGHISRIVTFGSVGFSAGARAWALKNEVEVVFASRTGSLQGVLRPAGSPLLVKRLRRQMDAVTSAESLEVAKAIVDAKIRKQYVLIQRFSRRKYREEARPAVDAMKRLLTMLPDCASTNEVMGLEGAAAREYFQTLGKIVPPELRFEGRNRRPPRDVVNACLSFGYTLLLSECTTAVTAAGLEPTLGVLHAEQSKRPSLAIDLMEEFRPFVVDQVVLSMIRRGEITPASGKQEPDRPGVFLTKACREGLIQTYESRMCQQMDNALVGFSGSIRRHVYRQAQRLAAWCEDSQSEWTGLSWRQ